MATFVQAVATRQDQTHLHVKMGAVNPHAIRQAFANICQANAMAVEDLGNGQMRGQRGSACGNIMFGPCTSYHSCTMSISSPDNGRTMIAAFSYENPLIPLLAVAPRNAFFDGFYQQIAAALVPLPQGQAPAPAGPPAGGYGTNNPPQQQQQNLPAQTGQNGANYSALPGQPAQNTGNQVV